MDESRDDPPSMTVAEFCHWADARPGQWELVNGRPRARPLMSITHGLIQAQAAFLIERHLADTHSPCRAALAVTVVPASFKRTNVRIADLALTCSPPGEDGWEVTDPIFILEVLSPMNEGDTRSNVWAYMTMPSVQQILLLASTAMKGEMFARQRDGTWPGEADPLAAGDTVRVEAIGFACTLAEFYAQTGLADR